MRQLTTTLLAGAACGALLIASPALAPNGTGVDIVQPAAAQARVSISLFFDALAPHGTWVRHARHGFVFVPAVEAGWRPYVHGHWVWTEEYGWYWASEEPFAWAAYHYGCWGYNPAFGWYWVPGTEWAPAWVVWRHGGGHVGWAPCAPPAQGYVVAAAEHYEPPIFEAWVFVPERRFVAFEVAQYVVPIVELNVVFPRAERVYRVQRRDRFFVNPFIPRQEAVQIVDQDITIVNVVQVQQHTEVTAPAEGEDTVAVFQAEIAEPTAEDAPAEAAESPDAIPEPPVLTETAPEVPEGAPRGAAQLEPEAPVAEPAEPPAEPAQPPVAEPAEPPAEPAQPPVAEPAEPPAEAAPPVAEPAEPPAEPTPPAAEAPPEPQAAPEPPAAQAPAEPTPPAAEGPAEPRAPAAEGPAEPAPPAAEAPAEQEPVGRGAEGESQEVKPERPRG